MSDTPRTDTAERTLYDHVNKRFQVVSIDIARTLEIELTAAQTRIAELEAQAKAPCNWHNACAFAKSMHVERMEAESRIAALTAQAKADAEDAARYRWLRDSANENDIRTTLLSRVQPHQINNRIDAARERGNG